MPQRANFQAHVYGVNGYHSDSIHERIGTWRGQEVRLLRIPVQNDNYMIFVPATHRNGNGFYLECRDRALLERYFEFEYGEIQCPLGTRRERIQ